MHSGLRRILEAKLVETSPWIIAVGASGADGLRDIQTFLNALPVPLRAAVLVVLHRRWDKPSHLREVLARSCPYPVEIADDGERFEPGSVYIGEPAQHLSLAGRSLNEIVDDPTRSYGNRTVDLLFGSIARNRTGRIIGVVLSGSLDDGSRGLAAIHEAGGITMVLAPEKPPNQGMPRNAIAYDGPIDQIGSAIEIAAAISKVIADD